MSGKYDIAPAIAMSLYQYNTPAPFRAEKLYRAFRGNCLPLDELTQLVDSANWATAMPYPTASLYLGHAMEKYGAEAYQRVIANEEDP